ncbi:hypothetical protein SAY87_030722 [Trapa incisa]|uniref:Serine/arginine repetitive matrix protein 1-like n=1 Tax=Trapa incisa TaxID=236973 RepID=A0AAN7KNY0_9MYRT|nr:hypothetical protein SAY87_030722 [Trapa incisa]
MGCCFSSAARERRAGKPQDHLLHHHVAVKPRPSLEEETVKEVLSETPLPQKLPPPEKVPEIIAPEPEGEKLAQPKICTFSCKKPGEEDGAAREDVSEYSEIYSASESLSTATTNTTVAEKREDDVTSRSRDGREFARRVRRSSPARASPDRQHSTSVDGRRVISMSPARRSGPTENRRLPPKRTQGVAASRTMRTMPRQCSGGDSKGRDSSGGYYRRSRSPARGKNGGTGRTSPARGKGVDEGRTIPARGKDVDAGSTSPARRMESGGHVKQVDSAGSGAGKGKDLKEESGKLEVEEKESEGAALKQETESLDNPLVSLECFIFL